MRFFFSRPKLLAIVAAIAWIWMMLFSLSRLSVLPHAKRQDYIDRLDTPQPVLVDPAENSRRPKIAHSKVAKVSVATNKLDNPIIHRALRSHEVQNEIHGYEHFIATNEALSDLTEHKTREPRGAWTKPAYLLSIVIFELEKAKGERLHWLFWFDADTVVINPQTPLEVFLPPEPEHSEVHLLMASNWDGLNSGAFAIRVHPWTASLLSAVLSYPIYMLEKSKKDSFRDQSAFQWLLESRDSPIRAQDGSDGRHWANVPMRWFNSLPFNNAFDKHKDGGWLLKHKMEGSLMDNGTTEVYDDGYGGKIQPWKVMQGDMVVHFAGTMTGGTRNSWMGPWLDRAESFLPEWNNKTTQLVLREEVREFWARRNNVR